MKITEHRKEKQKLNCLMFWNSQRNIGSLYFIQSVVIVNFRNNKI